jgi:thymidylate synthase (FAD)
VLEHIVYSFRIEGVSIAVLTELTRHRTGSFSVLSTRWALNKRLNKKTTPDSLRQYFFHTGNEKIDQLSFVQLLDMVRLLNETSSIPNDILKYPLPASFFTNIFFTIDLRNLRHLLFLRTAPDVLKEFKDLAYTLFEAIPEEHKEFCEDMLYGHEDYPGEELKRLKARIKELEGNVTDKL